MSRRLVRRSTAVLAILLALATLVLATGCMDGPPQPARVRYNEGVRLLAESKYEDAAKAFLEARSDAGYDGALRHRAAFNLGLTHARQAEQAAADGGERDPAAAIERYRQAAAWFSDALRLQADDRDARANLERVQARILALVDEVNQGEHGLEKRLDAIIAGERALRDAVRGLWQAQDARGAGADPLADKDAFDRTSTEQRTLAAEAGVVADLAGDEITAIGGKAEAERQAEEKARLVQLQNLDLYVQDARKEMTDARRNLTELKAELAYRRVEGALEALKRAREQLLDPVTVLRGVAQDHLELLGHVAGIEQARGARKLGEAPVELPRWMQPVALGGRQLDIRARLEEVKARLAAAKDQAQVKDAIAAATPALEEASGAMLRASEALRADDVTAAAVAQREALDALARAIEQFLDLRGLIDIALAEQGPVVAALTPPAEGQPAMSAAERARIVGDGATRNRERVVRMQQMIAELAKPPPPPADGQPAPPEDPEAVKQREELYGKAEALRAEAQVALDQLLVVAQGGKGPAALDSATTAQAKLEELQQLFYSVVEHLKKLIRDQGETRDRTTDAIGQDDLARKPMLPPIAQRQQGHVQTADAITNALAAQADAAAQQAAQGGGQAAPAGPPPQALKEAAGEVRNALTSMQTAIETLAKAGDPSATMSFDLSPVTESQQQAIAHLENALRLLQPPQKQDDKDQQQQQQQQQDQQQQDQQQQDQQQQQQQQQQDQSKDEAEQRLRQVREREAQRQRERRERQRAAPDPVDKDW